MLCIELQIFIYEISYRKKEIFNNLPKLYQFLHDTSEIEEYTNNISREITNLNMVSDINNKSTINCGSKIHKNYKSALYKDFIKNITTVSEILDDKFNLLDSKLLKK